MQTRMAECPSAVGNVEQDYFQRVVLKEAMCQVGPTSS